MPVVQFPPPQRRLEGVEGQKVGEVQARSLRELTVSRGSITNTGTPFDASACVLLALALPGWLLEGTAACLSFAWSDNDGSSL